MSHQALEYSRIKKSSNLSKGISLEIREDFALVKAKTLKKEIGKEEKDNGKRIKEKQKLWKIITNTC